MTIHHSFSQWKIICLICGYFCQKLLFLLNIDQVLMYKYVPAFMNGSQKNLGRSTLLQVYYNYQPFWKKIVNIFMTLGRTSWITLLLNSVKKNKKSNKKTHEGISWNQWKQSIRKGGGGASEGLSENKQIPSKRDIFDSPRL